MQLRLPHYLANFLAQNAVLSRLNASEMQEVQQQLQQEPRLSDKEIRQLVSEHLGPEAGFERTSRSNASYLPARRLVRVGPGFDRRSPVMHEIGHGQRSDEGRLTTKLYGLSKLFGPGLTAAGTLSAVAGSKSGRLQSLGATLAGLGISLPHLVEEHQATARARELMGEPGVGLDPAFRMYVHRAVSAPLTAGLGVGLLSRMLSKGRIKKASVGGRLQLLKKLLVRQPLPRRPTELVNRPNYVGWLKQIRKSETPDTPFGLAGVPTWVVDRRLAEIGGQPVSRLPESRLGVLLQRLTRA